MCSPADVLVPALAIVMMVSACGPGDGAAAPDEAPAEPQAAAPETAPPSPGAAPAATEPASTVRAEPSAPADACARARACCPAYVSVLPPSGRGEAGEACRTLELAAQLEDEAARDEACQGALEGFRASLAATGLEVPEACAPGTTSR